MGKLLTALNIQSMVAINKDLNVKITMYEVALAKICQTALNEYKEDRPASVLEETIEQVVLVDLGIDVDNIDDVFGLYDTALSAVKNG